MAALGCASLLGPSESLLLVPPPLPLPLPLSPSPLLSPLPSPLLSPLMSPLMSPLLSPSLSPSLSLSPLPSLSLHRLRFLSRPASNTAAAVFSWWMCMAWSGDVSTYTLHLASAAASESPAGRISYVLPALRMAPNSRSLHTASFAAASASAVWHASTSGSHGM